MTPVALMTGRREYASDCCNRLLYRSRQVIDPGFDLPLVEVPSSDLGAQQLQRSARRLDASRRDLRPRERLDLRITHQLVN